MDLSSLRNRAAALWARIAPRLWAVNWRRVLIVVGAVAALAVAAAIHTWRTRPAPLSTAGYSAPVPERKVVDIPRTPVPVQRVVAYDKKAVAKKLPALAPEISAQNRQVIANADIPATKGGASAVTVLDTDTGESRILVREKEPPFVEIENSGALGIRYGINEHLRTEGTLYGRWSALRVGAVHLGAYGEVNSEGGAKVQAALEYRW
ncbi:hypothetical protein [Geobacter sp.]|uniref:hypothetical protein n=1 Tax=Geobacter sp. TaxID=46610 RepID=UPI002618095D|nr:hypothetical protein [Geobacter sp.]